MAVTPSRRDEIAEKVMLMMLEKDASWFRDPKPLAFRSFAIADAMLNESSNVGKN
jgi:hypothetical protein